MNVILPEKTKYSIKDKIIYTLAIGLCIISLVSIIYLEIVHETSIIDMLDTTKLEEKKLGNKSQEETEALKTQINNKFTNSIEKNYVSGNIKKIDNKKDIIYTDIQTEKSKDNSYEIDIAVPYINIDSEITKKYNKEIDEIFKVKLKDILNSQNKNAIYTVEYVASVNNNNLSLMIRSKLKEGASAQRTIIQTYNYDIKGDKELTLEDVLRNNNLEENKIQNLIKEEIKISQKRVEDMKNLGYTIFSRNPDDEQYKIQNAKQFYCTSNTLYIVYAYGNNSFTSEVDVVVI